MYLMYIPSPLQQYRFHVILIWWHSPFKWPKYLNANFICRRIVDIFQVQVQKSGTRNTLVSKYIKSFVKVPI
jgi:hypothetical protein